MTSLLLILGVASIFCAGALANSYGKSGDINDFYTSVIGFALGIFILISMIGMIIE